MKKINNGCIGSVGNCTSCPNYVKCLTNCRRASVLKEHIRKMIAVCSLSMTLIVGLLSYGFMSKAVEKIEEAPSELAVESVTYQKSVDVMSGPVITPAVMVSSAPDNAILAKDLGEESAPPVAESKTDVEIPVAQEEQNSTQNVVIDGAVNDEPVVESAKTDNTSAVSANGPSEGYVYNLSDQDKCYIGRLIYKEARGELYEGKVAVAAVVLNRFVSTDPSFHNDSILSVIKQRSQFANIDNVTMEMVNKYPDIMRAVEDACKGYDPTRAVFPEGALYFYAPKEVSGYQAQVRSGIKVMELGNHNFHIDFNA